MRGRNAAKTFTATRSARFAENRKQAEERREERRANGEERELLLVNLSDVREGDEVATTDQTFRETMNREEWLVSNGQTMVRRFRTTEEG